MEAEQTTRKRRNLVIDDDDEDEPQNVPPPPPPKQAEKKEQPVEKAKVNVPEPTKNLKDENGNNKIVQNNQSVKNNVDNLNKKNQEKVVRKELERVQNVQQKLEVESDGHASDKDLFQPDDSNTEDIQEIRSKYGWKVKAAPQSAPKASKPASSSSSATKSTTSRSREEPQKKGKDTLVYEVLKRWWYALPDWPPAHYDYSPSLEANKLRVVSKQKFRIVPDTDERGFNKVYEILGYSGLFKDVNNKLYDLRPEEGKPSYTNIARKSEGELLSILKTCYQKQIDELEKSKVIDENLLSVLRKQYEKIKSRVKD